jgi:Cytochrome C and Quinol oxidase polypeptide I
VSVQPLGPLNFITTTLDMRTKGMSLMRLPLSAWAWFITSVMGLTAFAVLMPACILLILDQVAETSFFVPSQLGRRACACWSERPGRVCLTEGRKVHIKSSVWLMLALRFGACSWPDSNLFPELRSLLHAGGVLRFAHDSRLAQRILILIAPPTFMSIALVFVCHRRRNQTRKTDDSDDFDNPEDKEW